MTAEKDSAKETSNEPIVRIEIDTEDEFPGMERHMDVSIFEVVGDGENFVGHATVRSTSSPKQIADVLNFMATVIEKLGGESETPEATNYMVRVYRAAAKQVPGLTPDDGKEISLND